MGFIYNKLLGSDEGIKLGICYGKVVCTTIVNAYGITIGVDVGTDMGSLDVSFDGFNYGKLEGLFLGSSPGSSDGKDPDSAKDIIVGLFDDKFIGTILGNVD